MEEHKLDIQSQILTLFITRRDSPVLVYVTSRLVTLLTMCERRGTHSRSNLLS